MATEMHYESAGGLPVRSSTAEIRDLLAEGTLTKQTRVWFPGQRDWVPLVEVASKLLTTSLPHLAGHSTELYTVSPRSRDQRRSSSAIWAVTDEISPHGHNIREKPTTDSAVLGVVFTGERLKVHPRMRQQGWIRVQWGRADAWVMAEDGFRRFLLPTCVSVYPHQPRGGCKPAPLRAASIGPLDRLYYCHGEGTNRRAVPSTVRELRGLLDAGALDKTVLVRTSEMDQWLPVQQAEPLLEQLAEVHGASTKDPKRHKWQRHEAACVLQARWRGHRTRSAIGHTVREQMQERAATVVQARFRGHNTRRLLRVEQRRQLKAQHRLLDLATSGIPPHPTPASLSVHSPPSGPLQLPEAETPLPQQPAQPESGYRNDSDSGMQAVHNDLETRVEQMRIEKDLERQHERVSAVGEEDVASARESAAAEAARVVEDIIAAHEQAEASRGGLIGENISDSSKNTQRLSRTERQQVAKSQKAIVNLCMSEWLEEVSFVLTENLGSVLGQSLLDGGAATIAAYFEDAGCLTVLSVLAKASSAVELHKLCSNERGQQMIDFEVAAEIWAHLSPLISENKSAIKKERKELDKLSKKVQTQIEKEITQEAKLSQKPEPEPEPERPLPGLQLSEAVDQQQAPAVLQGVSHDVDANKQSEQQQLETLVLTPASPKDGFGMDLEDNCEVTAVHENSAAAVAGVRVGTVIIEVDGQKVADKDAIIAMLVREDASESSTCVDPSQCVATLARMTTILCAWSPGIASS